VVLITETGSDEERIFAGTIERTDLGEETLNTIELDPAAYNIVLASTSDSVYYTTPTLNGSVGYKQDLKTNARSVRFTSSLRDIVVTWEPSVIAYTTPTAFMRGYAYGGTGFTRLLGGVRGLMVVPTANYRVVSYAENNSLVSRVDTLDGTALPVSVFPEKCAADSTRDTILWCGAPFALAPAAYPDAWYEGSVSFDDTIWQIDIETGNATVVSVPSTDAGEAIDVTDMRVSDTGNTLIFINKKDGTLWLQETN
jgi:hypothetical protein